MQIIMVKLKAILQKTALTSAESLTSKAVTFFSTDVIVTLKKDQSLAVASNSRTLRY